MIILKNIFIFSFLLVFQFIYSQNTDTLNDNNQNISYNALKYKGGYNKLKQDIFLKTPYFSQSTNYGDSSDSIIVRIQFNNYCKIKQVDIFLQTDTILGRSIIHNLMMHSEWIKKDSTILSQKYETYLCIRIYKGERKKLLYDYVDYYEWEFYNSEKNSTDLNNIKIYELNVNNNILKNIPIKTYSFSTEPNVIFHKALHSDYIYFFSSFLSKISLPYFITSFNNKSNKNSYLLKFEFIEKNQKYTGWIKLDSIINTEFIGKIINLSNNVSKYKVGEKYVVLKNDIIDWIISQPNTKIGGFSYEMLMLNTLINKDKKLRKYINQDTIKKYSRLADLSIIDGVVIDSEVRPKYVRGDYDFNSFFYDNIKKREYFTYINSRTVRVNDDLIPKSYYLSFFILPNGKILNPKILNGSINKRQELIKIIKHMNKRLPAIQNGEKVISYKMIKLDFSYVYE